MLTHHEAPGPPSSVLRYPGSPDPPGPVQDPGQAPETTRRLHPGEAAGRNQDQDRTSAGAAAVGDCQYARKPRSL